MDYTMPQLLRSMIEQGASDLHLAPDSPPRLRIDGRLLPLDVDPIDPVKSKKLCYSILTEQQKRVFEEKKEIDMAFSIKDLARFRANIYLEKNCVSGAFRIIPFNVSSIDELGLPNVVRSFCKLPRGLVLVTGPTGSGKSTSLASMINEINENRFDHILTIEDPVEFVHENKNCLISQREIGQDSHSFEAALRSALRQDPDVVLVGEMRDLETISLALTTAETGHLVFGTLHTSSAVSSINRIIDVFPSHQQPQIRAQLALNLKGVISQILVESLQGGRALAMEVMVPNVAIANLLRENKVHQIYAAMQSGQSESGMQTLNQSLFNLYSRRMISKEMMFAKSSDHEELMEMIDKQRRMIDSRTKKRV